MLEPADDLASFKGLLLGLPLSLALWALIFSVAAHAQQGAPSPQDRAYSARIMQELNNSLSCSTSLIAAQDEIAALKAKLKGRCIDANCNKKESD